MTPVQPAQTEATEHPTDLRAAMAELQQARDAFGQAAGDAVDEMCYRVRAAELQVDRLFRLYKLDFATFRRQADGWVAEPRAEGDESV